MKRGGILGFVCLFFMFACSGEDGEITDNPVVAENDWLVDESNITGIFSLFPLVENPEFTGVSNINLPDEDLVGIVSFGSEVKVYPYIHTVQSEVINDTHNNFKYAFSYCPLTKSALAFTRTQIFRASGYLLYDNVTPWDSKTETIWSQMMVKGIKGDEKGRELNTIPVVETTWKTIKDYFPKAKVMINPFASGKNPPEDEDTDTSGDQTLPANGESVYGVLDNQEQPHIFRYRDFSGTKRHDVVIQGRNHIVVGDLGKRVINAFTVGNFEDFITLDPQEFPLVLQDKAGVKYDILGRGTNGSKLSSPKAAYVAVWKAWDDFFDGAVFK